MGRGGGEDGERRGEEGERRGRGGGEEGERRGRGGGEGGWSSKVEERISVSFT